MSRERDRQGRVVCNTVLGRRFCIVCGKWRLLVDFPPRKWADEDKIEIRYVQSECYACRRIQAKKRYINASKFLRKRMKYTSRVSKRRARRQAGVSEIGARITGYKNRDSVRREPFAQWLRDKKKEVGVDKLSEIIGMSPRRIHTMINGYDRSGRNMTSKRSGRLRQVDFVSFETVDRCLINWGEPPWIIDELYPLDETHSEDAA